MRANKKLTIVIISLLFLAAACINDQHNDQNNFVESMGKGDKEVIGKEGKRKFKNYTRPVLVDSAVFWNVEDGSEVKHYHINAYSEIDTANIEFYINWYDSIVDKFNGGRRSSVLFFNDKAGTPKIPLPTIVSDKGYEEHCFLWIKYERGALESYWDPFKEND
jgi:hypothetical protein